MLQTKEVISKECLDRYIEEAAKAAGYEERFGVRGCDLSKPIWWATYVRQSSEEQAQNNRIPEYLLTCARMAKERRVVVPREYVVVDHESSDYLDRRHMRFLRMELIAKRKISGGSFLCRAVLVQTQVNRASLRGNAAIMVWSLSLVMPQAVLTGLALLAV